MRPDAAGLGKPDPTSCPIKKKDSHTSLQGQAHTCVVWKSKNSATSMAEKQGYFFFTQKPNFNPFWPKTPRNLIKPIAGIQKHKKTGPKPEINSKPKIFPSLNLFFGVSKVKEHLIITPSLYGAIWHKKSTVLVA